MSFSPTESDAVTASLRMLADRPAPDDVTAPYDFAEFQRRAALRVQAGSSRAAERVLRAAAMIAPLALLLTIAGVERQSVIEDGSGVLVEDATEPALVRVGPMARVNDLEDRIAWLDTMITEAPVTGLDAEDRAELQSGREALASSLQRVRYAQTLLAY